MDGASSASTKPAEVGLAELWREFGTDPDTGLSDAEAAGRLTKYGPNEPAPIASPSWTRVLARQFASKLIWILVLATGASIVLQEWLNAGAIGVTVVVTAAFGFLNEWRSEQAIAALAKLTARRAEVLRGGQHEEIPARDVVPGDLVVVDDGDLVAADGRVVESRGLIVNESILTGEPEAVTKSVEADEDSERATPATMVFAGTTVAGGSGTLLVTATGPETQLGSIYRSMQLAERKPTPLEERLEELGNRLIVVFLVVCGLLVVVGVALGRDAQLVVEVAVSLAIGAVPEGLPAVATAALAIAVRQLAKHEVLVRRLDAVETLGSTTLIVTDKTGTLTENRMVVRSVVLADGTQVDLQIGEAEAGRLRTAVAAERRDEAEKLLVTAALSSDARVEFSIEDGWKSFGDPSETAIIRAAYGFGYGAGELDDRYPRRATEPFSTVTKMMTTTHGNEGGEFVAAKGAFQQLSEWAGEERAELRQAVRGLSDSGYRVLGVARDEGGRRTLLGAVVLEDPIRADAAEAVAACRAAGIRLMLVTGDHIATATTIAREAGILSDGQRAVNGPSLDLNDLADVGVVARSTHEQKEQIVAALQARGEVVAMTGDGVNDAAALRASHVGVAVGPNATDVAVEAADIFLSRGHLISLVEGITEGRQVTRSLREAIIYLLTASFATIVVIGGGLTISETPPLGPLQILWLNIVVHIFPALALAVSRERVAVSNHPTGGLFTRDTWIEVWTRAVVAGVAGLAALALANQLDLEPGRSQSLVYVTVAITLIGQGFLIGIRSPWMQGPRLRRRALWGAVGLSLTLLFAGAYLPGLHDALELEPPTVRDLAWAGFMVLVTWNVMQLAVLAATRLWGDPAET